MALWQSKDLCVASSPTCCIVTFTANRSWLTANCRRLAATLKTRKTGCFFF